MEPTFFKSGKEFRAWLAIHADSEKELLVGFYKTTSGKPSLTWPESVDEALCFGWIDGIRRSIDAESYSIRFTPRKPKSIWSKVNTRNAERLIEQNRMTPAGLTEVEKAKADGRWDAAYDGPKESEVPADFLQAIEGNQKAMVFFETLNRTNRYSIAWRLATAKRPETRAKRIVELIAMLERGETFHPQKSIKP